MKKIMQYEEFKNHSKFVNQTTTKILKNIGKYPKVSLSANEEYQFFNGIISIIQKKFDCVVDISIERNSKDKKANQALPGKPAIII